MMPPRLHYIRHGQTSWALSGQHTGRTDLALTPHGENEARALGPWLGKIAFTRVFTSPLQRARRTCALAGLGETAEIEPDLPEWDYGAYEGKTSAEIRAGRPGWDCLRDGCPGGESPADVAARADRLIARLRTMEGNIALFSHGEFGLAFAARWIGLPVEAGRHFILHTASLSILTTNPAHTHVPVIALWNATPT
jgi:probable phosphoglycerate mutase